MRESVKEKWLKALRSGEYEQGTGCLRDEDRFCCLGVLCDIYRKTRHRGSWVKKGTFTEFRVGGRDEYYILPPEVISWAGLETGNPTLTLSSEDESELATINDEGTDFEDIADLIEENL